MLKIRAQMIGRRNDRHFRIIVIEHTRGPKSGKYVDKLGFINPRTKEWKIDEEKAKYWLSVGAKPSGRIHNLLVDAGIIEGPKVNVLPKKTPIKKEGEQESGSETSDEKPESDSVDSNDDDAKDASESAQDETQAESAESSDANSDEESKESEG